MSSFPILQFGTSRFLQAHVDLFVSEAMERGEAIGSIVVVQTTSNPDSLRRLAAFQSGAPYPVRIRGLVAGETVDREVTVGSIRGGVDANNQWDELERLFCAARCVVSNTGDRGYEMDPGDEPNGDPPRSFPGKLAKLLIARYREGAAPLTLFPCELVRSNGDTLRAAVLSVIDRWGIGGATRRWIADDCVWVNSLVDRIVSQALEPVGAVAEPYALWAIENRTGLVPLCRHPDIKQTDDLESYESLKLFILNLGHTYLAQTWAGRGGAANLTVREMMADTTACAMLDDLYDSEVLPVFDGLGLGERARTYRETVVERFRNPFLDHRLADIYINHEAKRRRRFQGLIDLCESRGFSVAQPRLKAALGVGPPVSQS